MSLPKPYYQDSAVTLYHGDCRQIVPLLGRFDLLLTDPPYGTGWVRGGGRVGEFNAKHEKPYWDVFSTEWIAAIDANQFAVFSPVGRIDDTCAAFPARQVSYYRKTNVRPGAIPREAIVVSPPRSFGDFEAYNGDCPLHPCQKPLELIAWLVGQFPDAKTVLDPFAGSGTTGRACKDLGRKCVMIEREEKYCEIAARRMGQEVLPLDAA